MSQNLTVGPWAQIPFTGQEISLRTGAAGAYLASSNEFLLVGGWDNNYLSDFYSVNLTTLRSTRLSTNSILNARFYMAYTAGPADFYVHGGATSTGNYLFLSC
jgi:hypothetical protein